MLGNLFALQGPASPCEHNATLNQPPSRVCAQKRKVARTRPASAASLAAGAHNRLSRTIQPTKTPTRHQTDMLDPAQQKAPSFKHCMRAAEPACSSPWGAAALGGGLSATVTCPVLCSMHAQPPCLRHTKRQQHAFPACQAAGRRSGHLINTNQTASTTLPLGARQQAHCGNDRVAGASLGLSQAPDAGRGVSPCK